MPSEPKPLRDAFTRLAANMTVEQLEEVIKSLASPNHRHALDIFKAELDRRKSTN